MNPKVKSNVGHRLTLVQMLFENIFNAAEQNSAMTPVTVRKSSQHLKRLLSDLSATALQLRRDYDTTSYNHASSVEERKGITEQLASVRK